MRYTTHTRESKFRLNKVFNIWRILHALDVSALSKYFRESNDVIASYISGKEPFPVRHYKSLSVLHPAQIKAIENLIALPVRDLLVYNQQVQTRKEKEFEKLKSAYPSRQGPQRYKEAYNAYEMRLAKGWTFEQILEKVVNYHDHCNIFGKLNTRYVMQMASFLNSEECLTRVWEEAVHEPIGKGKIANKVLQSVCREELGGRCNR